MEHNRTYLSTLLKSKSPLFFILSTFIFLGILTSNIIKDTFSSSALLLPSESNNNVQTSSLVNLLAGGNNRANADSVKYIETLKSQDFYIFLDQNFIKSDTLDLSDPKSINDLHQIYLDQLDIYYDFDKDLLRINVVTEDPYLSYSLLEKTLEGINTYLVERERKSILSSINYLESKISETVSSSVNQTLSKVYEAKINQMLLMESQGEFLMKVLDSPKVASEPFGQARARIIGIFFITGAIVCLFLPLLLLTFGYELIGSLNPRSFKLNKIY